MSVTHDRAGRLILIARWSSFMHVPPFTGLPRGSGSPDSSGSESLCGLARCLHGGLGRFWGAGILGGIARVGLSHRESALPAPGPP